MSVNIFDALRDEDDSESTEQQEAKQKSWADIEDDQDEREQTKSVKSKTAPPVLPVASGPTLALRRSDVVGHKFEVNSKVAESNKKRFEERCRRREAAKVKQQSAEASKKTKTPESGAPKCHYHTTCGGYGDKSGDQQFWWPYCAKCYKTRTAGGCFTAHCPNKRHLSSVPGVFHDFCRECREFHASLQYPFEDDDD